MIPAGDPCWALLFCWALLEQTCQLLYHACSSLTAQQQRSVLTAGPCGIVQTFRTSAGDPSLISLQYLYHEGWGSHKWIKDLSHGRLITGVQAFKAPGKRQRVASRQNSDERLMGPPPPVQIADSSTPIGTPGQLAPLRIYTPSPLGYLPAKESTTAATLPVSPYPKSQGCLSYHDICRIDCEPC